jgi:transglutaminase/protease-like cytokinesis protein 3
VKGYNKNKGGKWSKKTYFKVNRGKAKTKKTKNKTNKNSGTKSNNSNKNTNKPKATPTKPKEVTIDPNYICNTEAEFYAIVKREIEKRSDDFIVYAGNGLDVTKLDGPNNLAPNIGGFNTEIISKFLSYWENIDGTKDEVQYKGKTYIKTIIGVYYKQYKEEDLAEYNKMVKLVKETEGTDVDKIVAFQEYLLNNYSYDHNYKKKLHHDVIDMLRDRVAICQQYSELATYVLNDAGIPCIYMDSWKLNHAWNIVDVDGEWYDCDFTGNILFDCVYTQGPATSNRKYRRELVQKRLSEKKDDSSDSDSFENKSKKTKNPNKKSTFKIFQEKSRIQWLKNRNSVLNKSHDTSFFMY